MRTNSIIRELNVRIVNHERVANEALFVREINTHTGAAKALRGAITLIESYRTDSDDSPANKET